MLFLNNVGTKFPSDFVVKSTVHWFVLVKHYLTLMFQNQWDVVKYSQWLSQSLILTRFIEVFKNEAQMTTNGNIGSGHQVKSGVSILHLIVTNN